MTSVLFKMLPTSDWFTNRVYLICVCKNGIDY